MKVDSILATIGDTPHVRINRLFDPRVEVWFKQERANPGGSIKDRIALAMIEDAEARGVLGPGSVIIEPTSGNTGIGLALVCAVKGYRLILVMPDSFSIERRKLMTGYGAELDLTPREIGMKGAIARANELAAEIPGAWIPMQFDNPANPDVHRRTTAQEILRDFPRRPRLHRRTASARAATSRASRRRLRRPGRRAGVFGGADACRRSSPAARTSPHPIQGIGAGFVPGVMRTDLLDGVFQVTPEDAMAFARRSAREEGYWSGCRRGRRWPRSAQWCPRCRTAPAILTFTYDTASATSRSRRSGADRGRARAYRGGSVAIRSARGLDEQASTRRSARPPVRSRGRGRAAARLPRDPPRPVGSRPAGGFRHLRPPGLGVPGRLQRGPHPGHHGGDLPVPQVEGIHGAAVHRARHARAVGAGWRTALEVWCPGVDVRDDAAGLHATPAISHASCAPPRPRAPLADGIV